MERGQIPVVQDWHLFTCSPCVLPGKCSPVSERSEHSRQELQGGVHFSWVGGVCAISAVVVETLPTSLPCDRYCWSAGSHLAWAPGRPTVWRWSPQGWRGMQAPGRVPGPPRATDALTPGCLGSPTRLPQWAVLLLW